MMPRMITNDRTRPIEMNPIVRPRIDRLRSEPVVLPESVGDLFELGIRFPGVGRMVPLGSIIYGGKERPAELFIPSLNSRIIIFILLNRIDQRVIDFHRINPLVFRNRQPGQRPG